MASEARHLNLYRVCRSVIHNLRVTVADPYCEGSIIVDRKLMDAGGFIPYEEVLVTNVERGGREVSYIVPGPAGSEVVETSGSLSKLARKGDLICIMAFVQTTDPGSVNRTELNLRGQNHHANL
jgi:aspartate 1-decarboxylase